MLEQFAEIVDSAVKALRAGADRDWSVNAGSLDWSCRDTAGLPSVADCPADADDGSGEQDDGAHDTGHAERDAHRGEP